MDDPDTPQLKITDLYQKRHSRDSARLKSYNQILSQLYNRIKGLSRLPNCPCYILYTIPQFIIGLPKIDLEDCVVYLTYQLRTNGFMVQYTYPNLLYISWKHHEKNYILEQSPILQAMIDTAEVANEKEKRSGGANSRVMNLMAPKKSARVSNSGLNGVGMVGGVSGGGSARKVQFRDDRDSGAPTVGQIPSAGEYVPPSSFIRTMEKPDVVRQNNVLGDLWNLK